MSAVADPLASTIAAAVGDLADAAGADRLIVGPFAPDLARTLSFRPHPRSGVVLGDADRVVRRLALHVLELVVSEHTFLVANAITALEADIGRASGWTKDQLPGDYVTSVIGDPSGAGPWCWRIEGHHLSVTATITGQEVVVSPVFLGSNPARLAKGPSTVLDLLAAERDLAEAALASMPDDLRRACRLDRVPSEVRFGSTPVVERSGLGGVHLSDLPVGPRGLLLELATTYLDRCAPAARAEVVEPGSLRFLWAGSPAPGDEVNYLLHSESLVCEYGNNLHHRPVANHVHTVFRRPADELGGLP